MYPSFENSTTGIAITFIQQSAGKPVHRPSVLLKYTREQAKSYRQIWQIFKTTYIHCITQYYA
jgi:hypothetical protein